MFYMTLKKVSELTPISLFFSKRKHLEFYFKTLNKLDHLFFIFYFNNQ